MNEMKIAVSKGTAFARRPLPIFRFNRRFVICCALCAATLQLAMGEMFLGRIRRAQPPAVVAQATKPLQLLSEPVVSREARFSDWGALQMAQPPRVNDVNHRGKRLADEFGIDGKGQAAALGSVPSAKLSIDGVMFATDDVTPSVLNALLFDYDNGLNRTVALNDNPHYRLPGPWEAMPRGVRFSPEINLESGMYVGVFVVVPFGD